jgi:SDR family mycofactocin-dependent oxidoreductase
MGNLEGQVAFITGGARGQGRSHALRLATDGADIVLVDICHNIASNKYDLATPADLHATAGMVEALDRRAVEIQADVRDFAALASALDGAVAQLGRLDIVVANAGIAPMSFDDDAHLGEQAFRDVVDVNLGGVWNTCRAALPHLIAGGRGGAMVLTSSTAGIKGYTDSTGGAMGYTAAKHGVVGIMHVLTNELAPHRIRVNSIHPTGVNTTMGNQSGGGLTERIANDFTVGSIFMNSLPVELVEPEDISNAVLFLASDEARYVTGLTMTVDAGSTAR